MESGLALSVRLQEQSMFYQQEILTPLQPFFVGDFKTNVCEVKYVQEAR